MLKLILGFSIIMKIVIDITSDLACPWCYVGWKRLESAISETSESESIEIRWHPYMIDVRTEKNGENYLEYNERRWGSDVWVSGMKQEGQRNGANFKNWSYGAPANELKKCVWANTFYAHCALMYVFEKKGWNAKHLFKTYLLEYITKKTVTSVSQRFYAMLIWNYLKKTPKS